MVRGRIPAGGLGLALTVLLGGCSFVERLQPQAMVTLYGLNNRAGVQDAWFALVPLADPPEAVGFGADGVACLQGPIGSELAWFDGAPGSGGSPVQEVGTVVADDGGASNVFWASVQADGSLVTGHGVPNWWPGEAQVCPP